MQTDFSPVFLDTPDGQEADSILRACVHCGFCTATCPTFLLTGNELDSPRGRIYLIKNMLEEGKASKVTRTHLDRCLSCQSCETTCPSDVNYHRLLTIGRAQVEKKVGRPPLKKLQMFLLRYGLQQPARFRFLLGMGRLFRFLLPGTLKKQIPARSREQWPQARHERKMLVLNGCVQNALSPATNAATARVLDRLGISVITARGEGCCGALAFHMDAQSQGRDRARALIDLLCQQLDDGVEAIISTASGCGNFIGDYPALFRDDPAYAEKARRVAGQTRDLLQILAQEDLQPLQVDPETKLVFHCPCTLQHGLGLAGAGEALLTQLGFRLGKVKDAHLCCGSAGTYSILQPAMAGDLRKEKITALEASQPEAIATANIGCQQHLAAVSSRPVRHWIEFVDEAISQDNGGDQS